MSSLGEEQPTVPPANPVTGDHLDGSTGTSPKPPASAGESSMFTTHANLNPNDVMARLASRLFDLLNLMALIPAMVSPSHHDSGRPYHAWCHRDAGDLPGSSEYGHCCDFSSGFHAFIWFPPKPGQEPSLPPYARLPCPKARKACSWTFLAWVMPTAYRISSPPSLHVPPLDTPERALSSNPNEA